MLETFSFMPSQVYTMILSKMTTDDAYVCFVFNFVNIYISSGITLTP